MLRKIISNQTLSLIPKNYFSAGHHAPAPSKLLKAEDRLIYLYIKNIENVYQKVPAFEGQSLLQTIQRMKIRGFQTSICDGYDATYQAHIRPHDPFSQGPQCGQCRIVLDTNTFKRLNQQTDGMSQQQQFMINQSQLDQQKNTRLACCIPIEKWMNGMSLDIDPVSLPGGESELF